MSKAIKYLRPASLWVFDYLMPVAVGSLVVLVLWMVDISRCRGLELWDPISHLIAAVSLHNDPDIKWFYHTPYPPLTYYLTNIVFLFMEPGRQAAELSVALFLIPFSLATYSLGRVYGGRPAGVICMVMPLLDIDFIGISQSYLTDVPLITVVALSLLAFHKAWDFQRTRWAVLLGLTLAAGMFTKYNFFFFVGPAVLSGALILIRRARGALLVPVGLAMLGALYCLYSSRTVYDFMFREPGWIQIILVGVTPLIAVYLPARLLGRSRLLPHLVKAPEQYHRVSNWLLALSLGVVPSLAWYIFNLTGMFWMLDKNRGLGLDREDHAYLCFLSLNKPWALALPMLLGGVVLIYFSKQRRHELGCLAAGGILAFAFMITSTDCNTRVFFGMLPFVLLLATWWLGYLGRAAWIMAALLIGLQVVGISQRWWEGTRYASICSQAVAGEVNPLKEGSSEEDRQRCKMDREVDRFVAEMKAMGDRARHLSCLYWDDKQLGEAGVMRLFPGVNCEVLAIKLGRSSERVMRITLHPSREGWRPPDPPPEDERDGTLLLYTGPRDAPIAKIRARFAELTGVELRYLRFRPVMGKMGFHLLAPAQPGLRSR